MLKNFCHGPAVQLSVTLMQIPSGVSAAPIITIALSLSIEMYLYCQKLYQNVKTSFIVFLEAIKYCPGLKGFPFLPSKATRFVL